MTKEYDCPVLSSAEALAAAENLAAEFSVGAADRDRYRQLPFHEMDRLSASGLLAITVPAELGGAGLAPSVVTEVIRILATGGKRRKQRPPEPRVGSVART